MKIRTIFLVPATSLALFAFSVLPCLADEEGRLVFSFVSSAYYMDKSWGQGMPWDGIRKIAETAHANGVPVTWLVSPESAAEGKELWKEYHDRWGDAFGHFATTKLSEASFAGGEHAYFDILTPKKTWKRLSDESESIRRSLPWADVRIGAAGHRSEKMAAAFLRLGYWGMWGHCWEQAFTDRITDRGSPWGFFYVNPNAFKAPNPANGGLTALEWTARDLNLSWRTGKPETFSTDPNDVGRAGICDAGQCDYWMGMIEQYARNAKYNAIAPLIVHQEAHEMECTDRICSYSPGDIEAAASMLDRLFKKVRELGAAIVTANEALGMWREANPITPPTFALFSDTLPERFGGTDFRAVKYEEVRPGETLSRFQDSLVYFDVNGQLFFERGRRTPLRIDNYLGDLNTRAVSFAQVENVPAAACEEKQEGSLHCVVESGERLPYGLAFWGKHESIEIRGVQKTVEKVLKDELAFAGFLIEPGRNELDVFLK